MIRWLALLLVPATLLFAVACGDDDDDDDDDADTETDETPIGDEEVVGDNIVPVEAVDFAFEYDASAITADLAGFSFTNGGTQEHELVVATVPEDFDLEAELEASAEDPDAPPPEGFEVINGTGSAPGEDGPPIEFTEPLAPGRYVMICLIPDEETGQPHFALGMVSEFTIE